MQEKNKPFCSQSILNNISSQISFQDQDYYLFIKKQQSGEHSLLFLTDFSQNFWVKKITDEYLMKLKQSLKIKTSNKVFIQHLIFGFRQNCRIVTFDPQATLMVRMKISDGLVINSTIKLDSHINIERNLSNFKLLLKIFGRQLFETKTQQIKQILVNQNINAKSDFKSNKQEIQHNMSNKSLFAKPQVKVVPQKFRNLIHPVKKKRRSEGMKLGNKQENQSSN